MERGKCVSTRTHGARCEAAGGFPSDAIDVDRARAALRASFVVRARGSGSGMSRQSETHPNARPKRKEKS
jgi:hypothetical protein